MVARVVLFSFSVLRSFHFEACRKMVQSSLPEVDALVRRCSELDAQAKLGRLGDPEAAAFFSDFSMERLMRWGAGLEALQA